MTTPCRVLPFSSRSAKRPVSDLSVTMVDIDKIHCEQFGRTELPNIDELASSIKQQGLIVPLIIRKDRSGSYETICGHRRLRAISKLGFIKAPCIIVDGPDDKMDQLALVENIQREELSDYEKALVFELLNQKHGMTYAQIGEAVGKSKQYVSNHIAMLSLLNDMKSETDRAKIKEVIAKISEHHARILLQVKDAKKRLALTISAAEHRTNVRMLERLVSTGRFFPSTDQKLTGKATSLYGIGSGQYIVAVEASAEKTICKIYKRQTLETFGEYDFAPANHHLLGVRKAAIRISDSVNDSLGLSQIPVDCVECIVICMSSVHTAHDMTMMARALRRLNLFGIVFVDRYVASLISAFGGKPGIIVKTDIGGVGVLGKNSLGQFSKSGGWGYLVDPSGSAYGIGAEALRCLSQYFDDPLHSRKLADHISRYLGIRNYRQLHELVYAKNIGIVEVAGMSEAVFKTAAEGDPDAKMILVKSALDLERLFFIAASRLSNSVTESFDVVLSGPVLRPRAGVYERLKDRLQNHPRVASVRFQNCDVLGGAVRIVSESEFSGLRNQILYKVGSPSQVEPQAEPRKLIVQKQRTS